MNIISPCVQEISQKEIFNDLQSVHNNIECDLHKINTHDDLNHHFENLDHDCHDKDPNFIQFDGYMGGNAIDNFGKFLKLKVGKPTIANSISNTVSIAKSKADDSSSSNIVQNVKSAINADAEGEKNSIAVSNVIGNTEAKSENKALDNSNVATVVDNVNKGDSTAIASENSLAVSSVKNDQVSNIDTSGSNNSNAVSGTQINTESNAKANAVDCSVADAKSIADEKSNIVTTGTNNSTAVGVTLVDTQTNSNAEAANQSSAQSLAESKNNANTGTVATDNSAALGASNILSTSDSTAQANDAGNALSTSEAKSNVVTDSVACDNSASVVTNNGGSNSNATSVSNGIVEPCVVPLEQTQPTPQICEPNPPICEPTPILTTPSTTIDCGCGTDKKPDLELKDHCDLNLTKTDITPCGCSEPKIPCILDDTSNITLKSAGTEGIIDKCLTEKEKIGTLEEHKNDVLKAAESHECTLNDKLHDECGCKPEFLKPECKLHDECGCKPEFLKPECKLHDECGCKPECKELQKDKECEELILKDKEDREKLKEDAICLKEENKKLRDEQKCEVNICEPVSGYESCNDPELNSDIQRDFDEGLKEHNKCDSRFNDENMSKDNIKEFDKRNNDQRVIDDCQDYCAKENLGEFIESEVQDILRGDFLFKCYCKGGITGWYKYNSRNNLSYAIGCQGGFLLDREEPDECESPVPEQEITPCTCANPILPSCPSAEPEERPVINLRGPSPPCYQEPEEYEEDEDADSICGNFVSQRIDAAKKRDGKSDKMHSDLGNCFNDFIENKFNKLHKRINKIKSKNTNYIKDLHRKQLQKQAGKVCDIVDKSSHKIGSDNFKGTNCNPTRGGDNLRNIQENLNCLKRDLKLSKKQEDTPEDCYFKKRNDIDQNRFNERLESRFKGKLGVENNRFVDRFGNQDRFAERDGCLGGLKSTLALKACSGNKSNDFIASQVGRIKDQNKDYLGKIKSMFGGCDTNTE